MGFWIIDYVLFLERIYLIFNQNRFLKGKQCYEIAIVGGSGTGIQGPKLRLHGKKERKDFKLILLAI